MLSLPVEDMRHETFWRQLTRGLVVNTPQNFQFSGKMNGDILTLRAELRNDEFEPEMELSVTAVVSPENGESVTLELTPSSEQPGVFEADYEPKTPGLIEAEAISRRGKTPLDTRRIMVHNDSDTAEYFNIRQNRSLLERISESTNGRYWPVNDLNALPEAIRLSKAGITEQTYNSLWDAPIVFLLLIFLKAIEWLLRRKWGTI